WKESISMLSLTVATSAAKKSWNATKPVSRHVAKADDLEPKVRPEKVAGTTSRNLAFLLPERFYTAKAHLRHQRAIFAVMHSGVRVQRCGNLRPLSPRTGLMRRRAFNRQEH